MLCFLKKNPVFFLNYAAITSGATFYYKIYVFKIIFIFITTKARYKLRGST